MQIKTSITIEDNDMWIDFMANCKKRKTNASAEINRYIKEYNERFKK